MIVGGKREGAGRKPTGLVSKRLSIGLKQETWMALDQYNAEELRSLVRYLLTKFAKEYLKK